MREEITKLLMKYTELEIDNERSVLPTIHFDKVADEIIDYFKNLGEGEAGTGYALLSDVADLETCPFCGSEAEIKSTTFGDNPNEYFRAACKGKANHSLDCWSDTSKCAIEVWNKRV